VSVQCVCFCHGLVLESVEATKCNQNSSDCNIAIEDLQIIYCLIVVIIRGYNV
jgi:hypothetical protein